MDRLDPEIGFLLEKQQVEFTYFEPEGAVSDEICDPKWMTVELNVKIIWILIKFNEWRAVDAL